MASLNLWSLLRREPALIVWSLFIISIPFYVLNAGMPQPGNLLVLFIIPKAMKWKRGWHGSMMKTLRPIVAPG